MSFQYDTDGSGQIEFPEFCNMMADKMNCTNDEDMIRMAFRVLDKEGSGTVSSKTFKFLMTHIGRQHCTSFFYPISLSWPHNKLDVSVH